MPIMSSYHRKKECLYVVGYHIGELRRGGIKYIAWVSSQGMSRIKNNTGLSFVARRECRRDQLEKEGEKASSIQESLSWSVVASVKECVVHGVSFQNKKNQCNRDGEKTSPRKKSNEAT